jgi:hypothetical protein
MLIRDHVVETISASSVQRILASEKLKPWRVHHWLSSKVPRDERFREIVHNICDLYTRPLGPHFSGGLRQIHLAAGSRSTRRHDPATNGGGILIHLVQVEAVDPRSGPARLGRQRCSILPRKA